MKKFDPVNRYENEIESWKNIIVISIFAAIGVNLIVSGLVLRIKSTYASTLVIIGIAICVCMSGLYIYNRLRSQKRSNVVRGFFIYDREEKAIIKIPRYEIVERMWLYMISVKTHNPKLRELWESDEVALVVEQKDKTPRYQIVKTESDKLFVELPSLSLISDNLMSALSSLSNISLPPSNTGFKLASSFSLSIGKIYFACLITLSNANLYLCNSFSSFKNLSNVS